MNAEKLLSKKVQGTMQKAIRPFANDEHDFEDILQECRIYLLDHVDDNAPISWVYRNCWQIAVQHARKADTYANHINYLFATAEEQEEEDSYDNILSDLLGESEPARSVEDEITNREERQTINEIFKTLSAKQERIARLLLSGLTQSQVCRLLGTSDGGISTQLPLIRNKITRHPLAPLLFTEAIPA